MSYQIRAGDTMERIAAFFGLPVETLVKYNPGKQWKGEWLHLSPTDADGRGFGSDLDGIPSADDFRSGGVVDAFGDPIPQETIDAVIVNQDAREEANIEKAERALTTDESPAPGAEGTGGGVTPGVMPGGRLVKIARPGAEDTYLQVYEFPAGSGKWLAWEFSNIDQVKATFGDDFATNGALRAVGTISWFNSSVNVVDSADEIIGLDNSFGTFITETMQQSAIAAGITDPTLYGRFVNDPGVQAVLAQAALGDWSKEQTRAALRNESFYQDVLYPGIDTFYGEAEPEVAYNNYKRNVEGALERLGVARVDGSYRSIIGDMLDSGVSDDLFVSSADTFVRAQQSPEFAEILNQWTERQLGRSLDFDTWFDVLAGQSEADVNLVVEEATLAYQAQQQGVGVSDAQIEAIATQSDLTEAQAAAAFSTYAKGLTALGDRGLAKYELTREEILAAAAGIKPSSGRSIEEIQRRARQAAEEEGVLDDPKLQFFVGYDASRGTPNRPGLNPLAPEGI